MHIRTFHKRVNLKDKQPTFARGSNGALVIAAERVAVEIDQHIVRQGVGRARCLLCQSDIGNDSRQRKLHIATKRHQRLLKETRDARHAEG